MLGKQKCKILKEIRQKIADENDIPYVTRECTHQGNCSGTCPRCESELRYLENQLQIRSSLGKKIKVAALCAGMALTAAGCSTISTVIGNNKPGEDLAGMIAYETPVPSLRHRGRSPLDAPGRGNADRGPADAGGPRRDRRY